MKKYCFTKCFKKKISKGAKITLQVLIALAVIVAVITVISVIGYAIGFGTNYFFPDFLKEGDNLVEVGFVVITMVIVFGLMLYLIVLGIIGATKGISNFAIERYEGKPYECKIFEECKEKK